MIDATRCFLRRFHVDGVPSTSDLFKKCVYQTKSTRHVHCLFVTPLLTDPYSHHTAFHAQSVVFLHPFYQTCSLSPLPPSLHIRPISRTYYQTIYLSCVLALTCISNGCGPLGILVGLDQLLCYSYTIFLLPFFTVRNSFSTLHYSHTLSTPSYSCCCTLSSPEGTRSTLARFSRCPASPSFLWMSFRSISRR